MLKKEHTKKKKEKNEVFAENQFQELMEWLILLLKTQKWIFMNRKNLYICQILSIKCSLLYCQGWWLCGKGWQHFASLSCIDGAETLWTSLMNNMPWEGPLLHLILMELNSKLLLVSILFQFPSGKRLPLSQGAIIMLISSPLHLLLIRKKSCLLHYQFYIVVPEWSC